MKNHVFLILFLVTGSLQAFDSISQLQEFATMMPEFPEPDTAQYQTPNYSSFYHHYAPSYFWQILQRLHIVAPPLWTPAQLENLLTDLVQNKMCLPTDHLIPVTSASRVYIWGDLKGAYHSLVRDLIALRNEGVIGDDLVLQQEVYLVFLGNVIDQSPYTVETLTAVLSLLKKNPCRVLYLAGNHEEKGLWQDHTLGQELQTKARGYTDESLPLGTLISELFKKLPRSIYLQSPDKELIQLSYQTQADRVVQGRVIGLDRSLTYQKTTGLELLPSQWGATTWNVFSSPTLTSKKLYNFTHDAFVLLTPAKHLSLWTITLYSKPIDADRFTQERFALLTGQPLRGLQPPLATKEPLLFGTTIDLSKTSASLGKRVREGLELRMHKENWQGGINGHPLKLVVLDDQYTPRLSLHHLRTLLSTYGTHRIVAPLGTPTTASFLPFVEEKKALVLFPYTGAMIFRKPELTYMAHLRTSYAQEAIALIRYAYTTLQARRFALFYQDDTYGQSPLKGAQSAFKELGISDWLETPYVRNNPNIEEAAQKIARYNPDVILFFSTYAPSAALIRKLGINKVASTVFMGISFLTDVFRNFLRSKGLELIMARVMPNPEVPTLEIIKNYQQDMRRYNPTAAWSVDSLEGYLNMDVLIYVLHSLEEPITDEAIMAQLENIKELEYKGLHLNFNPATRELLRDVWIDTGTGEWIKF